MFIKATKILCILILCLSLAFGSACIGNKSDEDSGTFSEANKTTSMGEVTTLDKSDKPVTIRFMTYEHVHSVLNMGIPTFKILGEKLNIKLEFETSSDYFTKVNMILASGDYPHVMYSEPHIMSRYYNTGIVYMLDELIAKKVPNLIIQCNKIDPSILKNMKDDNGHYWFLPKIEGSQYICMPYINGDWLKELNLEIPKTMEELYEVLKIFKERKGNNSIPWIKGPWTGLEHNGFNYFGTSMSWMHIKEGEYVYGPYERSAELKKALIYFNTAYKEGLLDRDFLSRDDDMLLSIIAQNRAGFFISAGDTGDVWSEGGTDGLNFYILAPWRGGPVTPYVRPMDKLTLPCYIMKSAEPVLDKILEMFNFIYSEEGVELFAWGIKDDTFVVESDGKYKFTDKILKHEMGPVIGRRQFGINPVSFPHIASSDAWDALMHPESVRGLQKTKKYFAPLDPWLSPTVNEAEELNQINSDLNKYVSDSIAKFIVGDMSIDKEFDNFLSTLEKLKVKRMIEIVKEQYSRWLKR